MSLLEIRFLPAYLIAGILLGSLYFGALWWTARCLASGSRPVTAIALSFGRFALLGGLLYCAGRQGALPLLAMALGILVARHAVMRRIREPAP
jgi:F1F0 ATPase subunit 2